MSNNRLVNLKWKNKRNSKPKFKLGDKKVNLFYRTVLSNGSDNTRKLILTHFRPIFMNYESYYEQCYLINVVSDRK